VSPTACVVGSGAREHALAHALARSARVVVAPGSDAMAAEGFEVTDASPLGIDADLFVVGPEEPLVRGLADELHARGATVVGPGREGARLEGSKAFMKDVLVAAGVPTARHGVFDDPDAAAAFVEELGGRVVVKTDGLAGGKGVLVTDDRDEALADVRAKLSGDAFGDAGRRVVLEELLDGEECSLLVLVDGATVVPLAPARDYKRLGDGGGGPNTGGMGAVSPAPRVDELLVKRILAEAVEPTLAELERRGIGYRGVLYAGVMATSTGPKLLEFNVRLGDPEAEVVLPRLADDPYELFEALATGSLGGVPRFVPEACVAIVLAAAGYPVAPVTGARISGLGPDGQLSRSIEGVTVFHGATTWRDGSFHANGGRVLTVSALGATIEEARARGYEAVDAIGFAGLQVRRDIAAGSDGVLR
jgi:phosphoribosylamine--glycine ligase